ncbi:MAG: 50S ribosomal protein L24 [bacterium]|nr:50S ribosomal protein L24 [bacterium]
MHIKKGDKVIVIAGKDKGKSGEIVFAIPKDNKVVVAGINKSKRHLKPKKQGSKGQILEKEMPLHASNVKLVAKK